MRALVVAAVTVCFGLGLLAEGRGPSLSSSSSQPTFRTGTTLVEVSAIVTRDGQPVTDLRREDVTVLDNGEPQPLVAYEYVDLGRGETAAQRRDFVLVIDDLHIHPSRTHPAIEAAMAFVNLLGPHDRIAVVHTGPPDDTLDFTTEREPVRTRVRATRGQKLVAAPAPGELELRARNALDVLRQVAAALRSDAAERRSVLLISEGHDAFTPEPRLGQRPDAEAVYVEFLGVLREAALANVAIYTVDPRGLRAGGTAALPSRAFGGAMAAAPMMISDLEGSLAALALNTGGLQTLWTNDLTRLFPRILQDSRQYYRLAYVQPEPPPGKKQPRTRSIQVKVSRPGLEVRARQRYAPG